MNTQARIDTVTQDLLAQLSVGQGRTAIYQEVIQEGHHLIDEVKKVALVWNGNDSLQKSSARSLYKTFKGSVVNLLKQRSELGGMKGAYYVHQEHELLVKKNSDYGSSFEKVAGDLGVISLAVRLSDKCNRLEELTTSDSALVEDESLTDTVEDLIGYVMLSMAWFLEIAPDIANTMDNIGIKDVGIKGKPGKEGHPQASKSLDELLLELKSHKGWWKDLEYPVKTQLDEFFNQPEENLTEGQRMLKKARTNGLSECSIALVMDKANSLVERYQEGLDAVPNESKNVLNAEGIGKALGSLGGIVAHPEKGII